MHTGKSKSRNRQASLLLVMAAAVLALALTYVMLGSGIAVAAPAATLNVDGSDPLCNDLVGMPYCTIQAAVDDAADGDEIRVAEGTYTETLGIGATMLMLRGGYESAGWTQDVDAHPTIVDGTGSSGHLIHVPPGANLYFEGFTVQNASPPHDGGGFGVFTATLTISATNVQSNTALAGAGFFASDSQVQIVNSTFSGNAITQSGAAIAAGNSDVTLDNVEISNNVAQEQGGGIWACGGPLTVTNSAITSNTAANNSGGGLYACDFATVTISGSQVISNTSGGGGGGLSLDNSTLSLNNVTVNDNQSNGSGGGLALSHAMAVITGGQIAGNIASSGGGLSLESATVTLNSVWVQGNLANSGGFAAGGGVDTNNSSLTINDSVIADNVVQSTGEALGGAINNNSGSVAMANSIIRNNNSQGTPVVQMYNSVFTVTNTLVEGNQGPGISGSPTQATFTNITVADNAGFGLGIHGVEPADPVQFDVNVTVVNSILWGNGGGDYSCGLSADQGSCSLSYSDVGAGDTTGTGNISEDPLFVDPANGDYHLGVGSPAVDAGTSTGAPPDDLEGTPRDAAPDMGAYEWVGFQTFLPITLK